jgi:hypothetical protein
MNRSICYNGNEYLDPLSHYLNSVHYFIVNQHRQKGKSNLASHVRSLRSVQESHESTSYLACIFPANRRKVLSLAPVTLLARSAPQPPAMVSR